MATTKAWHRPHRKRTSTPDLRCAEEATVREGLSVTRRRELVAAKARAAQGVVPDREALGALGHHLASLNDWRRCILGRLDGR